MKKVLNRSGHQFLFYHLPVLLYVVGLFILSSIPDLTTPKLGLKPQDKIYHFIFYTTFGFFVARSFHVQKTWLHLKIHHILYAILFTALYGVSDEFHQYFVPGRFCSIFDMVADGLGAVAGAGFFYFRYKILGALGIKQKVSR